MLYYPRWPFVLSVLCLFVWSHQELLTQTEEPQLTTVQSSFNLQEPLNVLMYWPDSTFQQDIIWNQYSGHNLIISVNSWWLHRILYWPNSTEKAQDNFSGSHSACETMWKLESSNICIKRAKPQAPFTNNIQLNYAFKSKWHNH